MLRSCDTTLIRSRWEVRTPISPRPLGKRLGLPRPTRQTAPLPFASGDAASHLDNVINVDYVTHTLCLRSACRFRQNKHFRTLSPRNLR